MLKSFIVLMADHRSLNRQEAEAAFEIIMSGQAEPAQIAAFLTALHMRGETNDEMMAAVTIMRQKMTSITAPSGAIDCCGTGGDKSGSLNISTAVSFVVAACGVPVAKHGNRAATSRSGAADILEALGVSLEVTSRMAEKSLSEIGLCFMMAPHYHPAMKQVAPVRSALGIQTIFNLMGPLCNPAKVTRQLVGVFSEQWLEPMAHVLKSLGSDTAWVVHGNDGLDEITITDTTKIAELKDGTIRCFEISPEELGLSRATPESLKGQDAPYNAKALMALLKGQVGPYRDIVLLNSAACLVIAGKAVDLREALEQAARAIDNGSAFQKLEQLKAVSGSQ